MKIDELNDENILDLLHDAGMLDKILIDMKKIELKEQQNKISAQDKRTEYVISNRVFTKAIGFRLVHGKAFLEFLNNTDPEK